MQEDAKEIKEGQTEEIRQDGDADFDENGEDPKAVFDKLHKKLKECQAEKQKYLDGWQRAQADFANFRRRNEEQLAAWSKTLGEGLIKDILPVLDSLDAASAADPDDKGLITLKNQLQAVLKKHGLEEIKSVGEKFNPQLHEVIESEEGQTAEESGLVISEIQKGYSLNGKLLRAAKIKVKK
jgi:molecular chaperone GrpE